MSYATYKLLHVVGIVLLMLGIGGALACARGQGGGRGLCMLMHGLGLLLLLVAGFGMQAIQKLGFPGWFVAKVCILLLLAFLPTMVRRGALTIGVGLLVAAFLAGAAGYLVLYKPF